MTTVAVYCGANFGHLPIYRQAAQTVGQWIGQKQYNLVYGGSDSGLMGVVADEVLKYQRHVLGVMPEFLLARENLHPKLSETILVTTMAQRKAKMLENADVLIALPGGPGTLEEISEAFSWARVGQQTSPCIFYNANGYYDLLQQFFKQMVTEGFLSQKDFELLLFSTDFAEIEQFILNYQA